MEHCIKCTYITAIALFLFMGLQYTYNIETIGPGRPGPVHDVYNISTRALGYTLPKIKKRPHNPLKILILVKLVCFYSCSVCFTKVCMPFFDVIEVLLQE